MQNPTLTFSAENNIICSSTSELERIHEAPYNVALLSRRIAHLEPELKALLGRQLQFQKSGSVKDIGIALQPYLHDNAAACPRLYTDVLGLLQVFEQLSSGRNFSLLLATIDHDMCRRFHTDLNYLRLLCTYNGPGTLWLPDAHVDRQALYHGGSNEEIIPEARHIQQAESGQVVILKGERYPNGSAAVHRSPSLEADEPPRLLLRIDVN